MLKHGTEFEDNVTHVDFQAARGVDPHAVGIGRRLVAESYDAVETEPKADTGLEVARRISSNIAFYRDDMVTDGELAA